MRSLQAFVSIRDIRGKIFCVFRVIRGHFFLFFGAIQVLSPSPAGWTGPLNATDDQKVAVTYIGNEGVMIAWKDKKVIIDGLHHSGNPIYERIPSERLESIIAGEPPFDGVDLVLVTHMHADHFDGESIGRFLEANPSARFVSSNQVVAAIKQDYKAFDHIESQIEAVSPAWKQTIQFSVNGIELKVLGMRHGSQRFRDIKNTGFVVTLGQMNLLHIGDADGEMENFQHFDLPRIGIDIGFIPYWFLSYPEFKPIVDSYIKPKHIVAIHVPSAEAEKATQEVLRSYPDADVFTTPLEQHFFPHNP